MVTLQKEAYSALLHRIDAMDINTYFARSVLTEDTDGQVFANRETDPTAFYIVHGYGMTLLFGDSGDKAFQSDLMNHFAQLERDEWLQAYPDAWQPFMQKVADTGLAAAYTRLNFAFDEKLFLLNSSPLQPEGYDVRPTPAALIGGLDGAVVPRHFWKPERYPSCVGYTVFADDLPVSTAFSSYIHGNVLEIGIETAESCRGKGLAFIAANALIRHCLMRGLTPCWSCRLENTGSRMLAKKLGFVETVRLPYYHIPRGKSRIE